MSEKTVYVDCPSCKARLEVVSETGKVIQSWKKENLHKSKDFIKEALKKQEKEKSRLDKYFKGASNEIEKRKKELSKQFEKEKNRIHKEKDYDKPEDPYRWD